MVISNRAAILSAIIDSGLTISEAAERCGINRDVFGRLLKADCSINTKTAGKLKRHFGDDVISIAQPAQILKG